MDDVMAVLGRKWSLFIIAILGNDSRTPFNDFLRQLKGISPRTLTDRQKELEGLRLIRRTAFPEVPRRICAHGRWEADAKGPHSLPGTVHRFRDGREESIQGSPR